MQVIIGDCWLLICDLYHTMKHWQIMVLNSDPGNIFYPHW